MTWHISGNFKSFKGKKLLAARCHLLQKVESVIKGGKLNAIMNSFCFLGDTEKPKV